MSGCPSRWTRLSAQWMRPSVRWGSAEEIPQESECYKHVENRTLVLEKMAQWIELLTGDEAAADPRSVPATACGYEAETNPKMGSP